MQILESYCRFHKIELQNLHDKRFPLHIEKYPPTFFKLTTKYFYKFQPTNTKGQETMPHYTQTLSRYPRFFHTPLFISYEVFEFIMKIKVSLRGYSISLMIHFTNTIHYSDKPNSRNTPNCKNSFLVVEITTKIEINHQKISLQSITLINLLHYITLQYRTIIVITMRKNIYLYL